MIQAMTPEYFEQFWPIFHRTVQGQSTFAFDPDLDCEQAFKVWVQDTQVSFVYLIDGQVAGSYYLRPNAAGPGKHICNCGYMVAEPARGQGIARQLCEHSQQQAKALGFLAMQFNSVVSTNVGAIKLWEKLGYRVIGSTPAGFKHPSKGFVDTLIMYKSL